MEKESPETNKGLSGENFENELELFKKEITKIQGDELSGRSQAADFVPNPELNLPKFEPQELTVEDMEIYKKVKAETVTREEWDVYHKNTLKILALAGDRAKVSTRIMFDEHIANTLNVIFYRREFEKNKNRSHEVLL